MDRLMGELDEWLYRMIGYGRLEDVNEIQLREYAFSRNPANQTTSVRGYEHVGTSKLDFQVSLEPYDDNGGVIVIRFAVVGTLLKQLNIPVALKEQTYAGRDGVLKRVVEQMQQEVPTQVLDACGNRVLAIIGALVVQSERLFGSR